MSRIPTMYPWSNPTSAARSGELFPGWRDYLPGGPKYRTGKEIAAREAELHQPRVLTERQQQIQEDLEYSRQIEAQLRRKGEEDLEWHVHADHSEGNYFRWHEHDSAVAEAKRLAREMGRPVFLDLLVWSHEARGVSGMRDSRWTYVPTARGVEERGPMSIR